MATPSSPLAGASTPPAPETAARRDRDGSITCEFCHASLASASGHVIKMTDDTRALRDAAEDRDKYKNQCASLTTKVAELQAEITRLTAAPTPAETKKHFLL